MAEISVVIPAYNEERRLGKTLESVYSYLAKNKNKFEIIVVDDGSLDHTVDVVDDFAKHFKTDSQDIRLLSYSPNQGKGYAVRVGVLAAHGDLILIDDADGSSAIEELGRLERAMENGADIAIGSRAKPDPDVKVEALPSRKFIGNTFNLIVQTLLVPGIMDTQCGFKLFKRSVALDLFTLNRVNGFGFDVEVLYVARLRGYKVAEVPINWTNVEGSKVNVFVHSPQMFLEVLGAACGGMIGTYKRPTSAVKRGPQGRPHE